MSSNYGSLRRRTRDSSWQWLIMGMILGVGASLVVCVAGYALGAITFPDLEAETNTPNVQIEPNQTEISALSTAANQTLMAQQAPLVTEAVTEAAEATTPIPAEVTNTPEASPLPENTTAGEPQITPSQTTNNAAASGGQVVDTEEASEPAVMSQDTPVVGTQPVGIPTQTITFAGNVSIPPELQAIISPMVSVSGGTFMMGTTLEEGSQAVDECALYEATCDIGDIQDSTPAHQITVDSFQMEIYEVSVSQYVEFLNFLGQNSHKSMCQGQPCAMTVTEEPTSYIGYDGTTYSVVNSEFYSNHPVTWVTWWGAQEYCRRIGRRLPTEAEWERAARGPRNFIYPWGFEYELSLANSSRPRGDAGTEPVDSYPTGATESGILNLAGNVEEWVSDWYQLNYYAQSEPANPMGPTTGTEKVLRGGSWDTVPLYLRAVHRRSQNPGQSSAATGFRCVQPGGASTTPPAGPVDTGTGEDTGDALPGGAPTLGAAATATPAVTPLPAGPTPTIDPGQ